MHFKSSYFAAPPARNLITGNVSLNFLMGNVKLDKQFQEFVNKLKSNYRDTVMGLCN